VTELLKKLGWKSMVAVLLLLCLLMGLAGVTGYVFHAWRSPSRPGPDQTEEQVDSAAGGQDKAAADEPEILFWSCSMHPAIREDGPGRCPICGMDLIPIMSGGGTGGGMRIFTTGPEGLALMDIRTTRVERRYVTAEVRMVGKVHYDETRLGYITAWVPGRLDRLYVDYTGIKVNEGDHMVYIYSPELLGAQEELLQALALARELGASDVSIMKETAEAMVETARDKLRLWGLKPEQIRKIERRGTTTDHMTIYAPMGGTVVHKNAQEGMYVKTGTRIYTIADLSKVWVQLDAYESDLEWLRYGQKVEFATEASPGQVFTGLIAFIDPVVNPKTRTVAVRVNVPNPDGRLKPDMFVKGLVRARVAKGGRVMVPDLAGKWIGPMHPEIVSDRPGLCTICGMALVKAEDLGYVPASEKEAARPIVIPATATLITGRRAIVYVKVPDAEKPTFEGREIVLGARAGDYYIVRRGLEEGELVVSRGNFKIDSALQIEAKPSMMTPEGGGSGGGQHHGGGTSSPAEDGAQPQQGQVPAGVLRQLHQVVQAYEAVLAAAETDDPVRVRAAFATFGGALEKVDAEPLSEDSRKMWAELSMLLGNDAFEGGEARRLAEVRGVLPLLQGHMKRLRGHFGIGHEGHAKAPGPVSLGAPQAFRKQLGAAWGSYRAIHAALVDDDADAAARAAKEMADALGKVDMALLDGTAHAAWMRVVPGINKALADAQAAEDLAGIRRAFEPLSVGFAEAVKLFGVDPASPVYKLLCPMAFDGEGGEWLQDDRETRNPYYGSQMPKCGDVIETIVAEPATAGSAR